jgi:hypothetical protein
MRDAKPASDTASEKTRHIPKVRVPSLLCCPSLVLLLISVSLRGLQQRLRFDGDGDRDRDCYCCVHFSSCVGKIVSRDVQKISEEECSGTCEYVRGRNPFKHLLKLRHQKRDGYKTNCTAVSISITTPGKICYDKDYFDIRYPFS